MKKKIIISIIVLIVTSMILLITPKNKNNELYAITIDGNKTNSIPEHGNYNVTVKCKNATGEWNYTEWKLKLNNITGNYTCNINFTTSSKQKLNDYIISLNGTTQGEGIVTNENGYRYEGSNPNNYILYNGELWRIIGVFDSTTHGVNGNLVKIIRNDSIGGLVYNTSDSVNSWEASTLYKLLNQTSGGSYYTGVDYTNKAYGTYCSSYKGTIPQDCSFSKTGIKSDYARGMIEKTKWYSTEYSSIGTAEDTYTKDTTTTTSIEEYIGLMYASDYGYGVKASDCARTISLESYNGSTNGLTCAGKNWLKSGQYEWTLSRYSISGTWAVCYGEGYIMAYYGIHIGKAVRPTLYLKSNVYYVSGSGTYDDPIIVGY